MDISTFRWILIIVGIAIVLGIFLFGNPDKKRKPKASRKTRAKRKSRATPKRSHARRVRREPALEPALEASLEEASPKDEDEGDARQAELDIDGLGHAQERIEPVLEPLREIKPRPVAKPMPEKIVTLFLQARDNHIITGVQLLDASLKSGLVFGERNIFHRIHEEDVEPIFSMANLIKPGSFDKDAWNTMEIKGVTMFMTLPGPRNALDAWDAMLATSRRLAELLHADLLDEKHQVFTRERSLQIKEEMREYERQKNAES